MTDIETSFKSEKYNIKTVIHTIRKRLYVLYKDNDKDSIT